MYLFVGNALDLPFSNDEFDLVLGSPPYLDARLYNRDDIARKVDDWVTFMVSCTHEALRVCKGAVLWVVSGVGGTSYQPGPEMLVAEMFKSGLCEVLRPNIWTKNAPPTGKHWFSNDWEYILAFAKKVPLPTWNPQELATPMKYKSGGHFRQRTKSGTRSKGGDYPTHEMRKRPSNVHHVTVGGGHMGWDKATEINEAPFPEALASRFIRVLTNPKDKVLDPFSGSATVPCVAEILGRTGYGIDIRPEQVQASAARQEYIDQVRNQLMEDSE